MEKTKQEPIEYLLRTLKVEICGGDDKLLNDAHNFNIDDVLRKLIEPSLLEKLSSGGLDGDELTTLMNMVRMESLQKNIDARMIALKILLQNNEEEDSLPSVEPSGICIQNTFTVTDHQSSRYAILIFYYFWFIKTYRILRLGLICIAPNLFVS